MTDHADFKKKNQQKKELREARDQVLHAAMEHLRAVREKRACSPDQLPTARQDVHTARRRLEKVTAKYAELVAEHEE